MYSNSVKMVLRFFSTLSCAFGLMICLFSPQARSADYSFTNFTFGGDFLNPLNWSPHGVPGAADNANFDLPVGPPVIWSASRTNANGLFNISNGSIFQEIGTNFWLLTNSYIVAQNAARTSSVIHITGELRVTNVLGTAAMIVGQNGRGAYLFNSAAASVIADRLFVTNNGPGFTNSTLLLSFGTLTTLHGSTIAQAGDFSIGSISNNTATWNILGGANNISIGGLAATILGDAAGAHGVVNVSGPSTAWTNSSALYVGNSGDSCHLVVSNGAKIVSGGGDIGVAQASINNQVLVTGAGSAWSNLADLLIGDSGAANRLIISNRGAVFNSDGGIGSAQSSSNNLVWVTDSGSVWSNHLNCDIGTAGSGNTVVVSNGASLFVGPTLTLGLFATSLSNTLAVSGGNVVVSNTETDHSLLLDGTLEVRRGKLDFNGGTITAGFLLVTNNGPTFTNSVFNFNYGTLTTINGSVVTQATKFDIGFKPGQTATWNMPGGTNTIAALVTSLGEFGHGVANVTGPSTVWTNAGSLFVGDNNGSSLLLVSNGASVFSSLDGEVGLQSTNNQVWITGTNSSWIHNGTLNVGNIIGWNSLVISNGGQLADIKGFLATLVSSSSNTAIVTGPGSLWNNTVLLNLGNNGGGNTLIVSNRGAVVANSSIILGVSPTSSNNTLVVSGGSVTTSLLDVRSGEVDLTGLLSTDQLLLTNGASSAFQFNAGFLDATAATVSNGQGFFIGNGASYAQLTTTNGVLTFADGLNVRSNGVLSAFGTTTISGSVTLFPGSEVWPGGLSHGGEPAAGNGQLVFMAPPSLQGQLTMQVRRDAGPTNDQVQVPGPLVYGGRLLVFDNDAAHKLQLGDRFPLFSAGSYAGAFSSIILPPLDPGLGWTNQLLVDGSIQVISLNVPRFNSVALSGTNLVLSGTGGPANATYVVLTTTNIAVPLTNWLALLTNQFDASGNFVFTNAIAPAVPKRLFRLQVP